MFGWFACAIIGLYFAYYLFMIELDLYAINKLDQDNNSTVEVDISNAVAGYQARDVRDLLDLNDTVDEADSENANSVDDSEPGGGGENIEYGLSDSQDFITNEYPEDVSVFALKEMFVENSKTPSLFEGLKFPA